MRCSTPPGRLDSRWVWWIAAMGRLKPGWTLAAADAHLRSISPALFRDTLHPDYSKATAESYLGFVLGAVGWFRGVFAFAKRVRPSSEAAAGHHGDRPADRMRQPGEPVVCAHVRTLARGVDSPRARRVARAGLQAAPPRELRRSPQSAQQVVSLSPWRLVAGSSCMMSSDVSPLFLALSIDWRVVAFSSGLMVVTCLLFGTAPALRASHASPEEALRGSGRPLTSRDGQPHAAAGAGRRSGRAFARCSSPADWCSAGASRTSSRPTPVSSNEESWSSTST